MWNLNASKELLTGEEVSVVVWHDGKWNIHQRFINIWSVSFTFTLLICHLGVVDASTCVFPETLDVNVMCLVSICFCRSFPVPIHNYWTHQRLLPGAQWGQIHRAQGKGLHLPPDPQGAREGKYKNTFFTITHKCVLMLCCFLVSWWHLASSCVWMPSSMCSPCFPSGWFWHFCDFSRCPVVASGKT